MMRRERAGSTSRGAPAWAAIGVLMALAGLGAIGARSTVVPEPAVAPASRLDLNTATAAELALIPGIGPAIAERIVAYRARFGGFRSMGQLQRVRGVGPRTAATIAEYVKLDE